MLRPNVSVCLINYAVLRLFIVSQYSSFLSGNTEVSADWAENSLKRLSRVNLYPILVYTNRFFVLTSGLAIIVSSLNTVKESFSNLSITTVSCGVYYIIIRVFSQD